MMALTNKPENIPACFFCAQPKLKLIWIVERSLGNNSERAKNMGGILVATILGGLVIGFVAGASSAPTGGNVGSAIAAFLVGAIGFGVGGQDLSGSQAEAIGNRCILFLVVLFASYIVTNILRKHRVLEPLGFEGPARQEPHGR
jgi:hypothetical protein